jgi:hypothetical protein
MSEGKPSFEEAASQTRTTLVGEFVAFIRTNRKWVLIPLIIFLLLAAGIVILGGTGAAPFIYTVF